MGKIEIQLIWLETRSSAHLRGRPNLCYFAECVMGINCLFPFLKEYLKKVNISEFSGKTAAIDASCWIHKALAVSVSESGNRERLENIFEKYLLMVKEAGVTPFVVFDGLPVPAKASETERRKREREDRLTKAGGEGLTSQEANKLRSQAVNITFEDITVCVNICLKEGVRYVVSPYESDAQIAFLLKHGFADFAISEDSDLLAYGCSKVVAKVRLSGDGEYFLQCDILRGLKLTLVQFQNMCIAAGCDYIRNVKGVGINKAFQMVSSSESFFDALSKRGAAHDYEERFLEAAAVFHHQTVFDIATLETVPLESWGNDPPVNLQHFCGELLDDVFANELAAGNVDPKSGKTVKLHPLLNKVTKQGCGKSKEPQTHNSSPESYGDAEECGAMHCEIIHVNRFSSFRWKIPCFPVMTMEFVKVVYKNGTETADGVLQKSMAGDIKKGKYSCTSHCQIQVDNIKCTVLWELNPTDQIVNLPPIKQATAIGDQDSEDSDSEDSDSEDSDSEDTDSEDSDSDEPQESPTVPEHSLPFKVMGTCHSTAHQKALKEAKEHLHEHNRHVFVKLLAEPQNPYDKQAIAVHIMSSAEYQKVGYIAKELTQYVHPVLNDPRHGVSVKKIRFCTTFQMIGLYLTIEITRRGLWENPVIKASRKVR